MELQRTTVRIKKPLFLTAKRLSLEKEVSLQEIINQALLIYLNRLMSWSQKITKQVEFADRNLNLKVKRPLTRKDLY